MVFLGVMQTWHHSYKPLEGMCVCVSLWINERSGPLWAHVAPRPSGLPMQKYGELKCYVTARKHSFCFKAKSFLHAASWTFPSFPFPAKYMGCYVDSIKNRALSGPSLIDYKKMTVARCQDNCEERYEGGKRCPPHLSFFLMNVSVQKYRKWKDYKQNQVIKRNASSVVVN